MIQAAADTGWTRGLQHNNDSM